MVAVSSGFAAVRLGYDWAITRPHSLEVVMRQFGRPFILTFFLLTCIWAQSPVSPIRPPQTIGEDDVVRITANLVQLDVTVTDSDGRQVTDLKPEDFEIREESRAQQITNFSYVPVSPERSVSIPGEKLPGGAARIV